MKIRYIVILSVILSSCLKLDNNLFNKKELKEYGLEKYAGLQEVSLDASYAIPDSMIHLMTLPSKGENEKASTDIYAVYIGQLNKIATDTVIVYCHGTKWRRSAGHA